MSDEHRERRLEEVESRLAAVERERDCVRDALHEISDALRNEATTDEQKVWMVCAILTNGPLDTAPGGPREDECWRLRARVEELEARLRDVIDVIDGHEADYSHCPHRCGTTGYCDAGCRDEPVCQTCAPAEGWPFERARALLSGSREEAWRGCPECGGDGSMAAPFDGHCPCAPFHGRRPDTNHDERTPDA